MVKSERQQFEWALICRTSKSRDERATLVIGPHFSFTSIEAIIEPSISMKRVATYLLNVVTQKRDPVLTDTIILQLAIKIP